MMRLNNKLQSNKFLASFTLLASGSIIAQIIAMLSSPITTRLFSPAQFGKYTIIATAISIFGPIISLKYDMAIVVAEDKNEANAIVKMSFLISVVLSALIGIIYGNLFLRDGFHHVERNVYSIVITILLFSYGINNILLAHNNRNSLYKLISTVTILKSSANSVLMIVFGFLRYGVGGLVASQLISSYAGVLRQSQGIKNEIKEIIRITLLEQRKVFIKYIRQPLFNATSALVTTTVYSSINLFIKIVYSYEYLGLYSLSYRVLGIPFSVISANFARIFYDTASKELKARKSFHQTFKSTLKLLIITIVPTMMLMALVAPTIFSLIFGEEWIEAGYFVRLLTPMFAIRLIAESLTTSFIISGKQQIELIFQIGLLLGEVLIFILAYFLSYEINTSLILISILYVVIYLIMITFMNKLSKETR